VARVQVLSGEEPPLRASPPIPCLFAHSVQVHPHTLAASSSLVVRQSACSSTCLHMVYRCTRTHSPHPANSYGHSFPSQLNLRRMR